MTTRYDADPFHRSLAEMRALAALAAMELEPIGDFGHPRGQRMLCGEVEYRLTLTRNGLLGMVAFLNTETLRNQQTDERLFDSLATGAGLGVRLLINKGSKTNLCLDYGWGREGSHGLYLAVQEAF